MQGVTVTFGTFTALSSVSVSAEAHQVLGVIGPNGAGKSTLLNVVRGSLRPDSGRIGWAGRDYKRIRPRDLRELGIAYIPQEPGPLETDTVLECVMTGADDRPPSLFHDGKWGRPPSGKESWAAMERAAALLRELGVARYAGSPPDALPLAIRKRVALARALVANPELLLLDELADGLSSDEAAELGGLVRKLSRRMTLILVEHHMDLVMQACDHLVVLDAGRVIATGTPAEIQADPTVRAVYLDEH
jgi:branched-chain amino acid transport system ATP-binding protein